MDPDPTSTFDDLPDPARLIWLDGPGREVAIARLAEAWERGRVADAQDAVNEIDSAVVMGLATVGLPRGPVTRVSVQRVGRSWLGQKRPDCALVFDGDVLRVALRVQRRPDEIIRTWVHESLHARQPYALPATELREWRGYEEGLAEALARHVTGVLAGMDILAASYAYYVGAYEAIAAAAGVPVEAFLRSLWMVPTGRVRTVFVNTLDRLRREDGARPMSEEQSRRLRLLADRVFSTARTGDPRPEAGVVEAAVERMLR